MSEQQRKRLEFLLVIRTHIRNLIMVTERSMKLHLCPMRTLYRTLSQRYLWLNVINSRFRKTKALGQVVRFFVKAAPRRPGAMRHHQDALLPLMMKKKKTQCLAVRSFQRLSCLRPCSQVTFALIKKWEPKMNTRQKSQAMIYTRLLIKTTRVL